MIAADTNIVVRLLMRDDEVQWQIADTLFRSARVALLPTVLLEVEWVLRGTYALHRRDVLAGMRLLCGLDVAMVPDRATIDQALLAYASGFDFADALHLEIARSSGCDSVATLDRKFASLARRTARPLPVELLRSNR